MSETKEQRDHRYMVENMAALIRRMALRLKKTGKDDDIANKAIEYLASKGLEGKTLRTYNGGEVA